MTPRRHVIIEGPDGAGKTTLLGTVQSHGFAPHPRASHSVKGPQTNLANWVMDDLCTLAEQPPQVYDRHPVISEPIYGPICRGTVPDMFGKPDWLGTMRGWLSNHAVLVLCIPPLPHVRRNVGRADQMRGVVEHIEEIWWAYNDVVNAWPGKVVFYDYTSDLVSTTIEQIKEITHG